MADLSAGIGIGPQPTTEINIFLVTWRRAGQKALILHHSEENVTHEAEAIPDCR